MAGAPRERRQQARREAPGQRAQADARLPDARRGPRGAERPQPPADGGRARRDRAADLLEAVGLERRLTRLPRQLGYGERRRLALAVSLANRPRLLLADEITAGLDDDAADHLLADLNELLGELGTSAIVV